MTGNPPTEASLLTVRRFHLDGGDVAVDAGLVPALLAPFRDARAVRTPYPLYLAPKGTLQSVSDLLEQAAPSSRVLADNLLRYEALAASKVVDARVPVRGFVDQAGAQVRAALGLAEAADAELHAAHSDLVASLPEGDLLGFGPASALQLLLHALDAVQLDARAQVRGVVERHAQALQDTLDAARPAGGGGGAPFLDVGALQALAGDVRGSVPLGDARTARLEANLAALRSWLDAQPAKAAMVCDVAHDWMSGLGCDLIEAPDPCAVAMEVFDRLAANAAASFGAARAAALEAESAYDPERHGAALASFDWRGFSEAELAALPLVVVHTSAEALFRTGLVSFLQLLASGRPVQVLVAVSPADDPAGEGLQRFRLELGQIALGLRQVVVCQSTPARPTHLIEGFQLALAQVRGGVHLLAAGESEAVGPWLLAGAALEGRAHPLFRFDPSRAEVGEGFDLSGNPALADPWPSYDDVVFTFADFALLRPSLRHHFMLVPDDCDDADLVDVASWLALAPDDALHKVPVVAAVDGAGVRRRLAITRALVFACRDRMRTWRTLQHQSGVRDSFALAAAQRARAEAEAEAAAAREALLQAHDVELGEVRAAEAGVAMQRLAEVLLNQDLSAVPGPPRLASQPAPASAETVPQAEDASPEVPAEPLAPDDDDELGDPYIDSVLCTSCGDCLNVNSLVFVYDGNKQAVFGDVSKGKYEELVRAAEACPANCIHPGAPLNPSEAGVQELMVRARALEA